MYFYSPTVATGDEVRLDLAVALDNIREYRRDSPSRTAFFRRKSSFSMTIGLPASLAQATTLATASPMTASAMLQPTVGNERYPPSVHQASVTTARCCIQVYRLSVTTGTSIPRTGEHPPDPA